MIDGASSAQTGVDPLPDYESPPVVEVVLAVGFRPLPGLRLIQLAQLWESEFRSSFPTVEEQPPVAVQMERLDDQREGPSLRFDLMQTPPLPRLWLLSETGTQLVQVQNDWFARNWRKMAPVADYPRYPNLKEPFSVDFGKLAEFLRRNDLGEILPTQCELTYINHIPVMPGQAEQLADILSIVATPKPGGFLPIAESIRVASQYVVRLQEEPVGRLHIAAEPAFRRSDSSPIVVLTLTARGRPLGVGLDGVLAFLDLGHEWIVRAFDSVTTSKMHRIWGRKVNG
ncbi:MAG: TIGR04255 family protein [Candidatus Limnocylindrales bacterium]|jgi:uncharacterized protein (TIGR04255 family)